MCVASWFTAADIFVAGIALDLIGATLIAWPIVTRSATEIANLYQLGGFNMATLTGGNRAAAAKAARETAMSRVGVVCLLLGFAIQGAGYFMRVTRGLEGREEAMGAAVIIGAEIVVAATTTWLLVRWLAPRILAAAQSTRAVPPPAAPPTPPAAA
jgi:hypothetical protein